METLVEKLKKSAQSLVCFGMDPTSEGLPWAYLGNYLRIMYKDEDPSEVLVTEGHLTEFFFTQIWLKLQRQAFVGAVKLNEGFFLQFDNKDSFPGTTALNGILGTTEPTQAPIILDIKRGDIGKSSENYAKHAFAPYGKYTRKSIDAVTIHPYMGTDSVEPFLRMGAAYVLCRTSNKGSEDIQDVKLENGRSLYMHIASLIAGKWYDISPGNIGAVVGATGLDELEHIASFFKKSGREIPLLIPGVGKQGGSAKEVVERLRKVDYDLRIVRINSSSGITEAWKKQGYTPADYAKAAVDEIQRLNEEIGKI